jgi:hypothetical protein
MRKRSWISKIILAFEAGKFLPLNYFRVEKFREFKRDFWNFYFCKSASADKNILFYNVDKMKISNTFKESISKTGIYTTRFRWTKNVCFKMFTSWKFLSILKANFKSCGQFTINFRWTKSICFKTLTSWKISKFGKAFFASSFRVTRRSSQQVCLWNCGWTNAHSAFNHYFAFVVGWGWRFSNATTS